jgi:hypothetical protein
MGKLMTIQEEEIPFFHESAALPDYDINLIG